MVFVVPQERPKVVVKADLLPAISVLSLFGLLGIPVGWLWSRLAPPQRSLIADNGKPVPFEIETWHSYDALAIFGVLTFAMGVVIAVIVWLLRERRGPVIMVAAVLGSLMAAWLASMMGAGPFTGGLYTVDKPPKVFDVVDQAPELTTDWALLIAPLATALVYGLLAAWNGRDDLGRRLG